MADKAIMKTISKIIAGIIAEKMKEMWLTILQQKKVNQGIHDKRNNRFLINMLKIVS